LNKKPLKLFIKIHKKVLKENNSINIGKGICDKVSNFIRSSI
jgi:hypothetical protein